MALDMKAWLADHREKEAKRIAAGNLHFQEQIKKCPKCGEDTVVHTEFDCGPKDTTYDQCQHCGAEIEWHINWWIDYIVEGAIEVDGVKVTETGEK